MVVNEEIGTIGLDVYHGPVGSESSGLRRVRFLKAYLVTYDMECHGLEQGVSTSFRVLFGWVA